MPKGLFKSHKLRALLLYPLYFLSYLMKRNPRLWLFGPMNHAFLDNAKYLFLYVTRHHPEISAYFVTEKPELFKQLQAQNLPVVNKWSFKGFWLGLRAKYYIISAYVDDINFWTSGGATVFNLWHGIPLKKIEFDIQSGPLAKRYLKKPLYLRIFKPHFYRRPNYVLSTSKEVSHLFASAFRVKPEQCPVLGYPRTDIFFKSPEEIEQHVQNFEPPALQQLLKLMQGFQKVVLYMPTWRDTRNNFLEQAFPQIERLNDVLQKQSALFLLKLHPNDASLKTFGDWSHVKTLPAKIDLYPLLPFTDLLLTDYSSIFFDYMLLNKPIVFYPFDLQDYLEHREMYFSYNSVLPGPVVENFEQLLNVLSHLSQLQIGEKYALLRQRFWEFQDGNSGQRVTEFLLNLEH